MKTTSSGIIVARHVIETIKLAPIRIDHDLEFARIIEGLYGHDSGINYTNIPDCNAGKNGIEEASLFLVRPVPYWQVWLTDRVLSLLDEAGFVQEEFPTLFSLMGHAEELCKARIDNISALGEHSRWRHSNGNIFAPFMSLYAAKFGYPAFCEFESKFIGSKWSEDNWLVVRHK
ncbi:MAG: hypothetical protein UT66_C0034G0002 [candidate division CPR2 bacterium GW2011_GWC1_39_9]|uniref:Uncharacterized protein n=1 Tax=candidate division CPR2 bacterium GW2011_GWC2_39_10 TaxID=1618345 RepID=A0A0G0LRR4_UNCC2|nr:MAG: hypothetical protein UT18_C0009G0009 [candidate division CPR2 bacterium GW2011_GWC2_39_10]KKR33743.1 MAG: hypothetical protein UT66_C0034G0002 [candidate division CPR2 bacterium GW2011_GWC1_39_9]